MILTFAFVYMISKISISRETEQKYKLMQQQEQLQMNMYCELNKKYQTAREIAHDIERHIAALNALIDHEEDKQAEKYLSDLSKIAERLKPNIKNQNVMLAIILNTTLERCEKENIELNMNVEDFSLGFIDDIDVTTIFSNLLDNAIDACLELPKEQRRINIIIRSKIGLVVINITNSCIQSKSGIFSINHSTKSNHSGIGLMNVKKTVDKYDGVFSIKRNIDTFCTSITFSKSR